jgi:hypothetical protein
MWLESPLQQGIRDALRLLGKGADEVNVFDLRVVNGTNVSPTSKCLDLRVFTGRSGGLLVVTRTFI